ncbi:DNA primase [Spiroplasma endosymbiont of Amphibalanus improvisus]|uniref:DNA primase n=1 Tax=Spiroplasma endosymbiont of Amphibalanus improvisus TaxID=3066327 RepID=UPI00313EA5E5
MPLISQTIINQIINETNIVNVISKYLDVKKSGKNFLALCPFHSDSSPSLNINSEKRIYHCFSCNAGGNIIRFVQEFEKITFPSAAQKLAKELGIAIVGNDINNFTSKYSDKQNRIFEVNELAFIFFQNSLFSSLGKVAIQYLEKRKITEDSFDIFMIGYCPKFSKFIPFMLENNVTYDEMLKFGLLKKTDNNYFPIFDQRLIFTLKNADSKIVGFSGRIIDKESKLAKYLNSPETLVFKKSELIYNLDIAANQIRMNKCVVIVEGYMDVIALNQIGIKSVLALMGTKFSKYHINQLKKITNNIILFLDGDTPGIKASLEVTKILIENGFTIKMVNNKTELDPGEIIEKFSKNHVIELVANPIANYYYFLEKWKYEVFNNQSLLKTIYFLIFYSEKGEFANRNHKKIIINISEKYNENFDDLWNEFIALTNKLPKKTIHAVENFDKIKLLQHPIADNKLYNDLEEPDFLGNANKDYFLNEFSDVSNIYQNNNDELKSDDQVFYNLKKEYGVNIFNLECKLLLGICKSKKVNDFYQNQIGHFNIPLLGLIADSVNLWYNDNIDVFSLNIKDYEKGYKTYSGLIQQIMSAFLLNKPQSIDTLLKYKLQIDNYSEIIKIDILKKKLKNIVNYQDKLKLSEQIISLSKNIKGDFNA